MLQAILHGKKRGTGTEGESLADTFAGAEDTLTSTLFERLLYLPDDLVGACLLQPHGWNPSCAASCTPRYEIADAHFWPRWEPSEKLSVSEGKKYVEPDFVIEWKHPDLVLIIEAKRCDYENQQLPKELAWEWAAGRRRFKQKPLCLLAVGGLRDTRRKTISDLKEEVLSILNKDDHHEFDDFQFAAEPWYELFRRVEKVLTEGFPARHAGTARMLEDIREGLALHGITASAPGWLEDLVQDEYRTILGLSENSFELFHGSLANLPNSPHPGLKGLVDMVARQGMIVTGPEVLVSLLGGTK